MFSEQMLTEYINKSGYVHSIAEGLGEYETAYKRRFGRSGFDEYDFEVGFNKRNSKSAQVDMAKLYATSKVLVYVYHRSKSWDEFIVEASPRIMQTMELNSRIVESRCVCRLIAKAIFAFFERIRI